MLREEKLQELKRQNKMVTDLLLLQERTKRRE